MNESEFRDRFRKLISYEPLSWQWRLFRDHFAKLDHLPNVIDLPTGLGKTMVMAIWLIAREDNKQLPRRLIYVVDRRTVVDQATDLAETLVKNWKTQKVFQGDPPAISTLRGQLADNRDWSRDPSRPAIIIGTVDLIGSALLFSGYRSSFKRRPLEAGLLGQDSLLVLDEAHLSKPFEKLLNSIESQFQVRRAGGVSPLMPGHLETPDLMKGPFETVSEPFQAIHENSTFPVMPLQVIRMSATSGDSTDSKPFRLHLADDGNLTGEDARDPTITERFGASKTLRISESDKLVETIAEEADNLATEKPGSRIVIFVQTPKLVADVRKALEGRKKKDHANRMAQLTGTMRGLERDELVDLKTPLKDDDHERRVMQRFLVPDNDPLQGGCFLISTSAGEVGFDLNADHLVGDEAPLDSWIQRLGRVNRRGKGDATVVLVKKKTPAGKTAFDNACLATSELLTNGMPLSPRALAEFRKSLTPEETKKATSPESTTVDLTDILLDAWSMTSIIERMPGRPEVAPWLRGIADDLPQTTIAWRAELELFKDHQMPQKAFKAIFAKHRVRTHESLTTKSHRVVEFLKQAVSPKGGRPELRDIRVVVMLSRNIVLRTVGELIDNNGILNADPTLILPATFGGLDKGMLSADAIPPSPGPDRPEPPSLDVADKPDYEPDEDSRARLRILIERTEEGWKPLQLPGGEPIPADLNLDPNYEKSTKLFRSLVKSGLRIRLVQPLKWDDEGSPTFSLVFLAPIGSNPDKVDQLLDEHVGKVETEALRIADELGLPKPLRETLLFAAKWHDEGKKADIWQRFIGGPQNGQPLGKAATTRDPKSLHGYRHEFGSLLSLRHPERRNTDCTMPTDPETRDLALHLIASHHGFGRPHFDNPFDRDFKTVQCEQVHTDAIRRFARLQRRYGWWRLAWLENLLRCADALASADEDAEDDTEGESNEEARGDV